MGGSGLCGVMWDMSSVCELETQWQGACGLVHTCVSSRRGARRWGVAGCGGIGKKYVVSHESWDIYVGEVSESSHQGDQEMGGGMLGKERGKRTFGSLKTVSSTQ